jgi:hypothetical protein
MSTGHVDGPGGRRTPVETARQRRSVITENEEGNKTLVGRAIQFGRLRTERRVYQANGNIKQSKYFCTTVIGTR